MILFGRVVLSTVRHHGCLLIILCRVVCSMSVFWSVESSMACWKLPMGIIKMSWRNELLSYMSCTYFGAPNMYTAPVGMKSPICFS